MRALMASRDAFGIRFERRFGDRSTGRRIRTYRLPDKFGVTVQSPKGEVEITGNTQGRIANKGMEGLAISPDGRTLYCAMQSPLEPGRRRRRGAYAHRAHRRAHRHRERNRLPAGITSDNIPAKLEGFAFDDADLGAGSSGLERQEFSDHLCDDDAWQTFHRDACDDHRH